MTNKEIKEKVEGYIPLVEDCLLRTLLKAEIIYGIKLDIPDVRYDIRGKRAGEADWGCNKIRLNPILLAENGISYIESTVPHEMSHLIDAKLRGNSDHGHFWKVIMRGLGHDPSRCHSYDVRNTLKNAYIYTCSCGKEHIFTQRKHNSVRRRERFYICRVCRQRCEYVRAHHSCNS